MRIHLLVASVILALAGAAQGQTYPDKPVKMLVGFAPGGSADLSARAVSDGLAAALGKPVVGENRPGAGSIVAATAVARSDPDGYTLMYGGISLSIQMAIDPAIPIDPLAEFQTVGLIAEAPNVLVVGNQIPARTVKELVGYARSHRINYGSVGVGTSLYLLGEILKDREKLDMVHVPYKGRVPALNDMMGGRLAVTRVQRGGRRIRDPQIADGVRVADRALPQPPCVLQGAARCLRDRRVSAQYARQGNQERVDGAPAGYRCELNESTRRQFDQET